MRVIDELTMDQAYELINSGKFYNGSDVSEMSTTDLINCRKYAVDHYYDKWYWVHFYHLVNNEIKKRGIVTKNEVKNYWNDPRVLDVDPLYH